MMKLKVPLLGIKELLLLTSHGRVTLFSFDGCGPEENELIKSLKKASEKGEIRLL